MSTPEASPQLNCSSSGVVEAVGNLPGSAEGVMPTSTGTAGLEAPAQEGSLTAFGERLGRLAREDGGDARLAELLQVRAIRVVSSMWQTCVTMVACKHGTQQCWGWFPAAL